jgi:hypothetical protein
LDPADRAGFNSSLTGRIVCISLLVDDGRGVSEVRLVNDGDEKKILEEYWSIVRPTDVHIGTGISGVVLPFIRQRTWILGVRSGEVIDQYEQAGHEIDLWEIALPPAYRVHKAAQLRGILPKTVSIAYQEAIEGYWRCGELAHIACLCQDANREDYAFHYSLLRRPLPMRFVKLGISL